MQLMAKIVNAFSSAEGLLHVFEWVSIGAGALTVASLIGIALTSRTVSRQNKIAFEALKGHVAQAQTEASGAKAAQQRVETQLAKARSREAEAETKLEEIRKRQERRGADWTKFTNELYGKPTSDLEIFCQPNDDEAYSLASIMSLMLATAGWPLVQPVPIPENMGIQPPTYVDAQGKPITLRPDIQAMLEKQAKEMPPTVRAGAGGAALGSFTFGIFVVANKDLGDWQELDSATPAGALVNALNAVGLNAGVGPANNELPDNKLRIIVAAKP